MAKERADGNAKDGRRRRSIADMRWNRFLAMLLGLIAVLVMASIAGVVLLVNERAQTTSVDPAPAAAAPLSPPNRDSAISSQPPPVSSSPPAPASAAPQPVALAFGTRSELPDGWRLGASRPYLCDVLMAIPVLQKDGTRIMRVTLTLTNRTGAPQATRMWKLAAIADGTPAELVLWPAKRFRGVPDMTLESGRSVGFLVAFRVPEHPVQVRITAERDAAPRAVLTGTL